MLPPLPIKKELTEDDVLDRRILYRRYNRFTIAEFHYMAFGYLLGTIQWFVVIMFLLLLGRLIIVR